MGVATSPHPAAKDQRSSCCDRVQKNMQYTISTPKIQHSAISNYEVSSLQRHKRVWVVLFTIAGPAQGFGQLCMGTKSAKDWQLFSPLLSLAAPLGYVSSFKVTSSTSTSVSLSWSAVPAATKYKIAWRPVGAEKGKVRLVAAILLGQMASGTRSPILSQDAMSTPMK